MNLNQLAQTALGNLASPALETMAKSAAVQGALALIKSKAAGVYTGLVKAEQEVTAWTASHPVVAQAATDLEQLIETAFPAAKPIIDVANSLFDEVQSVLASDPTVPTVTVLQPSTAEPAATMPAATVTEPTSVLEPAA